MLAAARDISPGLAGFLVVAGIGVALWLLVRSMNRQLHRINFDPPEEDPPDQSQGEEQPPAR